MSTSHMSTKDDKVPRQMLLDSQESVTRLKRQLQGALSNTDSEVNVAVTTLQAQIRALQKQQKTTEEQLSRSLAREHDLREQVVSSDIMTVMGQLRKENKELRSQNEALSEQATKGQESEAQLVVTRNKLEAAREEILRVRTGNDLEVQSTREELETLKRALEEAKVDTIRSEQVMTARKEMQQAIDRSAEMLNERDKQIVELQEERDKACAARTATEVEARTTVTKIADLERELRREQKRVEEAAQLQAESEKVNSKQLLQISGLEEQLAHAQESLKKMADRLKETETELSSVHGDMRLLRDNTARESGSLALQLRETKTNLEILTESSTKAEEEHRTARDVYRQDLQKAESECKHLRDVLRKERDLLEKLMGDQAEKESQHAEQRQRLEDQASRREMVLSTRLQSTEKELDALRLSSVPESKFRSLQDQFDREREQLQTRLDMALEDAARAQQQKTVGLRELEQQNLTLSTEADIAGSKVRSLEAKLREAEEMYASERKARLIASDQLRAFKGEFAFMKKIDDLKLTKVAQAAMEAVGNAVHVFDTIEKGLEDPSRDNLDGQQRTAIGIAVVENMVEETIPGSPADLCGLISAGDEILAVDGKPVEGSGVAAALRGDDLIGGVVSVTLRKQSNEVLEVHLPRADIIVVSTRRQLCEDLAEFSTQAVQAIQHHQPEVLGDRLDQILASMKALEQLDVNVQYRLGMQIAELTKGFHNVIKSAFRGIEQLDHAHQQAHASQEQIEEDLRANLARGKEIAEDQTHEEANLSDIAELHAQVQAAGRDLRHIQNELRARNMQVAEAKQEIERLREALIIAEEKAVIFEEGQKTMRVTVMNMEEELADAVAQVVEFPFAIEVGVNVLWEAEMQDHASRSAFESQLLEDVAFALQIPKNAVSVICYHRDDDQVTAILKMCNVMPSGSTMHTGLRTSKALAAEFAQQIADLDSLLRSRPVGSLMKECTLQGPVSEMTVKAIGMAWLDAERDTGWRHDEVLRLQEQIKRAEDRAKESSEAYLKETEALRLENLDLTHKTSKATKEGAKHSALLAQQHLETQHQIQMTELKRKHKVESEDWERTIKTKDYEISVLKERIAADEIRNSSFKSEKDKGYEIARSAQDAYHKLQVASAQMCDLVEPEIKACINTLNNVESEMAFFHAHQTRALQIATSMSGASLEDKVLEKDQADAAYSKEMVERDIETLRSQLEGLSALTAADGELASKFQLPRLVAARMTPSRAFYSGERDGVERSEGISPDSPALRSASRRLALEEADPLRDAIAIQGCVVAVQNLPVSTELEGKHISVAISLLPSNADPHAVEHFLSGSSHLSTRSFTHFPSVFGSRIKSKRGKTGKEVTFIHPQYHTKQIPAASSSWQSDEDFCLDEHHTLQAVNCSEGEQPEMVGLSTATKLDGDVATLLVTLMAGAGDGDVPCSYARCVVNMITGDDIDKWHPLEDLDGAIISDASTPASIRVRAKYSKRDINSRSSATPTGDHKGSLLFKARDGSYVC